MTDTTAPDLLRDPKRWLYFTVALVVASIGLSLMPTGEVPESVTIGAWTSVLPPLVAVLMAIFFRKLLLALSTAVAVGSVLAFWDPAVEAADGAMAAAVPIQVMTRGFDAFIVQNLADDFNIYVFLFTFALVGMVHVMSRSGGVHGMIDVIVRYAKGRRSTRIATALMGLVIFFDDYANSVVVGTTMRKLTDARRISREKLAYLVDSTAAPVSGVAIVSTWIAFEVGLFNEVSQSIGLGRDGYEIFLSVLPFRFYCLVALVFVFVGSASGRDFGPMLKAERRALNEGKPLADDAQPLASESFDSINPPDGKPRNAWNAVVPIIAVVVAVTFGMLLDGRDAVLAEGQPFSLGSMDTWRVAYGDASSAKVLFWSAMFGSAVAIAMGVGQRIISFADAVENWVKAIPAMKLAVGILLLAWAIKSVCGELNTSGFLISSLGSWVSLTILPLVTFLLAGVVAFSTGTSWGTMGILLPVALPLAYSMGDGGAHDTMVMWLVASAVLDGAIFGDHCSPISDTTVLSSIASGSDHLHHVRTQIPYAMTAMTIAAGLGYVGVAAGLPLMIAYPAMLVGVVAVFFVIGRPIETKEVSAESGAAS